MIYPEAIRSQFPGLHGCCDAGIFVEGPDGRYRRFPPCSSDTVISAPFAPIDWKFRFEIDSNYDAHPDSIHERKAGYVVDAQGLTAWFEVDGTPVSSISKDLTTYALPGLKWMMAQADFEGSSPACAAMLLAEGKSQADVVKLLEAMTSLSPSPTTWNKDLARNNDGFCSLLEAISGRKTLVIRGGNLQSQELIQTLKDGIAAHGPCNFELNKHNVIFDAIEDTADGVLITVRDPLPVSILKTKPDETFWTRRLVFDPSWCLPSRKWTATFLTKNPV